MGADHQHVAGFERAAGDQHGRQRALALVEPGLDHGGFRRAIGVGAQFEQFGLEQDLLDQSVETRAGLGRNLDVLDVAAHRLDHHFVLEQALADLLGIGLGLVHFVDRHDHRHARRMGVMDRLDRLRHDPVVGGDHQHDDIGDVRTTCAHLAERLVARSIEEGDQLAALGLDLVGTDMLGDPAGLAADHIGPAQRVEHAGLAVIDMAHDRDHRGPRLERLGRIDVVRGVDIDVAFRDALDGVAKFLDQQLGGVLVDRLVDGDHHPQLEQRLDQVCALFRHAVGEFLDGDALGHHDVAALLFARLRLARKMRALFLFARPLERGERTGTGALVLVERAGDGKLARLTPAFAAGFVARVGDLLGFDRALDRGYGREPARRG